MVRRYLTEEGLKVSEAGDGATMRKALESEAIDLVLLDLVMPGEDGLSLAREIRRNSEVPIIMVTGKGDLIDRVVGLEAGADDYIAKPFHLREILARIRTVSRRAQSRAAPPAPRRPRRRPRRSRSRAGPWTCCAGTCARPMARRFPSPPPSSSCFGCSCTTPTGC